MNGGKLTTADFPEFFTQVHQRPSAGVDDPLPEPFRWQVKLLERVAREGWPELIDVPTGLGKTAVIDVAIFAAALPGVTCPRRVFFVVDRRLVVDEAYQHARALSTALEAASPESAAGQVAAALRVSGHDGPALEVTRMRGGTAWSWLWLGRPDQHAVITGTVDQVGSRLFFRGYGVGKNLRPIDAALTGTDSLIIIDEAHLARSFASSARAALSIDTTPEHIRPVIVEMSASPGHAHARVHTTGPDEDSHPVAGKRLHAPKRLWLSDVPASKRSADQAMADAHAAWAEHLSGDGSVTGVIVNTVGRARAVFSRLQARHPGRCVLLTGRTRGVDREYLLHDWYDRIRAGRPRGSGEPLFVVSTQTIEVGANIDLDALVTETASLPALVQRLGRLNRLGQLRSGHSAPAVVLHCDADHDGAYGPARAALRKWLAVHGDLLPRPGSPLPRGGGLDVSPAALRLLAGAVAPHVAEEMREPQPYTPVLFPAVLDTWACTSPAPWPDTPVDPFLHGIGRDPGQVSVVWRDLPDDSSLWAEMVAALPPMAGETIDIPVALVRRWLAGVGGASDIGDLDADTGFQPDADSTQARPARVLRYRTRDDVAVIPASLTRPGDLIVVPASAGGCDQYGWNPASTRPVTDVADLASGGRQPAILRLGGGLADAVRGRYPVLAASLDALADDVRNDLAGGQVRPAAYAKAISELADSASGGSDQGQELPHVRVLGQLGKAGQQLKVPGAGEPGTTPAVIPLAAGTGWLRGDATAAGSSFSGCPAGLDGHQIAVAAKVAEFARNLGIGRTPASSAKVAGRWHDEGKREQRFQVMLHGGDRWRAAIAARPLAKSGIDPGDQAAGRRARRLSGYPAGMRHEALSAQIARHLIAGCGQDIDPDLVLHLIASHHGRGRPLLPPVTDPHPCHAVSRDGSVLDVDTGQSVDWSAPARFAELNRRYGRWGLARLEAVVRLADIWCSARNEQAPGEEEDDD